MFIPTLAFAKVELFQIVVFDWDRVNNRLEFKSLGSGTAIDKDLILTNRHVVETSANNFADLLLLCQARQQAGRSVTCDIAAGVAAVHPTEDVALVKPIESAFFPQVKLSFHTRRPGDSVRVHGFPSPLGDKVGFGDTRTFQAFGAWAKDPSQPFPKVGDKLTITRGQVTSRLLNTQTDFTYAKTDAKANFGNSGGAVFDVHEKYLGIVTLKDREDNALFLEYYQLDDWVDDNRNLKPNYDSSAYSAYKKSTQTTTPTKAITTTTATPLSRKQALYERLRQRRNARATSTNAETTAEVVSKSGKTLTSNQRRLYEYLRQKRAQKSRVD